MINNPYVAMFVRSIALMGVMYALGYTIFVAYSVAVIHDAVSLYLLFQDDPMLVWDP